MGPIHRNYVTNRKVTIKVNVQFITIIEKNVITVTVTKKNSANYQSVTKKKFCRATITNQTLIDREGTFILLG